VTKPQSPQEGTIRIDQPEKSVKMKEGRRRPQPPQSAVLTQPDGHNQPAETPPAVSRPIPPRIEKKMGIGQPESPVKREEGGRVTNQPHAIEPAQSGKRVEHHRNQPAARETIAPVPQRDISIERPERPAQMRQERPLTKPAPQQAEPREIAPGQPVYRQQSPSSGHAEPQQYQQRYAPRQGFQLR